MKLRLEVIGIAVMLICPAFAKVTIENVIATQREGTKLVDIHYDVTSDVTNLVDVAIRLSDGAMDLAAYSFSGDIGESVSTGTGKLIVWNAGADQSNIAATVQVHLIIDDGASDPNVYVPPCPVAQTGQINSYAFGDDGDLLAGIAWPEPRFVNQGGVLIDYLTGLMWQVVWSDDGYGRRYLGGASTSWSNALSQCADSTHDGYSDWRLPTIKEAVTLRDCGSYPAWSSDIYADDGILDIMTSITNPFDTNQFYVYYPSDGTVFAQQKTLGSSFIAVRTIQPSASAPVPCSGQTYSYYPADAGDLQVGTPWPSPRFIDAGETVTDRLTGLEWVKDPSQFGEMTWNSAVTICQGLVFDGRDDWRLPNVNELESLIDRSRFLPVLPVGHPFKNVPSSLFWTSSTLGNTTRSYSISLTTGEVGSEWFYSGPVVDRTTPCYIWPVRGGE